MPGFRVPAEQVLHVFHPIAEGQIRGVPWVAPAMVRLWLLDQYDDAELDRKKVAAMFAGFVTRPGPDDVTAVPGGGLNYLPQVDPVSSEARLFLLDMPVIRDSDDVGRAATGHYWAAAAWFDPPWRGAVLFSSDDGAVYVAVDETLDAVACPTSPPRASATASTRCS